VKESKVPGEFQLTAVRDKQAKWFPAGNIFHDIKIFHLTIFNTVLAEGNK
jgi:hypothetical protein